MIEGITVLSCKEVYTNSSTSIIFLIIAAFLVIAGTIMGILSIKYDLGTTFLTIGFIVMLIVSLILADCLPFPKHMIYKVTINDSVSMVEFNEKYDILSTEGLIYEICLKEGD